MCEFCLYDKRIMENDTCFAFRSESPISHGHTIVTTKRHVESYFDLNYKELEDMNQLVKNVKSRIDKMVYPDGYNLAINVGRWAGQETLHTAIHVIPRYAGDVSATELRGGIVHLPKGEKSNESSK